MRLAVSLIILLAPCASLGADRFGAIAYSASTRAHGWAKDHPAREAAEKAALAGCAKHAEDCKPVLWFRNACGALAAGANGPGWAWAQDQAAAERGALKLCATHSKGCTVKHRFCTTK